MTHHYRLPPAEYRKEKGLLLTSKAQRKACWERDKGKCAKCNTTYLSMKLVNFNNPEWRTKETHATIENALFEADHCFPLHAIPESSVYPDALKFWKIGNLQTLCFQCHRAKSKKEVKANAKVKRIRQKLDARKYRKAKIKKSRFIPRPAKQIREDYA